MSVSENKSRLVAEFDKNSAELVRIHFVDWKKTTYADIRVWYKTEAGDDGDIRPTTKGLRINVELLPDLIRALNEAQRLLEAGPEVEVVSENL
jgi:hypothetical protein